MNLFQGVTFLKPGEPKPDSRERNLSSVPAPKKLVDSAFNSMPPPPPRNMPPPPPKFNSTSAPAQNGPENNVLEKPIQETVPDTLIKLMEYGDDEDEDDETTAEPRRGDKNEVATSKPFWSV